MNQGERIDRTESISEADSIPAPGDPCPVIATHLIFTAFLFVIFVLPNIIFSGNFWFESLHLMKWAAVFVPTGILLMLVGLRIAFVERAREDLILDPFGAVWLFFALLLLLQPLWAHITSIPTFVREWFFFASLWGIYLVLRNYLKEGSIKLLIWGAAVNGALNVIFAELQIREMQGILSVIYPTSGMYIGNTGQQNMFGLWLAIAMFGSAWIFLSSQYDDGERSSRRMPEIASIILFSINSWGIWNSTSRSAVLSFAAGFAVLVILMKRRIGWNPLIRRVAVIAAILAITFFGVLVIGRGNAFVMKTRQMVSHFQTVGKRDSIWATSWTMLRINPVRGVGLGHFKWNYLDAQREMLQKRPSMKWQYTYWAHNEILHWFCETGIVGGILLLAAGSWWISAFFRRLRSGAVFSAEVMWACGFLFLIWFNALWTRPFHRIENAVWMALAFAVANRAILPSRASWTEIRRPWILRGLGAAITVCAASGLFFFGSGLMGDRILRIALSEEKPFVQRALLERANRHLMVSDIAERELAYHYIRYSQKTKQSEYLSEGLTRLHLSFMKQPHSREMIRLIAWYSDVKEGVLLESVAQYLKPGSYAIEDGSIKLSSEDFKRFFGSK